MPPPLQNQGLRVKTMRYRALILIFTVCAVSGLLTITPASADSIGGNWCFTAGRHFSIDSPDIVTPAGTPTVGDYARHSFLYTVPENETGAGALVAMRLLDENTIQLATGSDAGETSKSPTQIWQRCFPVTS
jgi:hypothetical protein